LISNYYSSYTHYTIYIIVYTIHDYILYSSYYYIQTVLILLQMHDLNIKNPKICNLNVHQQRADDIYK